MTPPVARLLAALVLALPLGALAQEDPGLELLVQDFDAAGISDPENPFEGDLEQELSAWFLSIRYNNAGEKAHFAAYHALEGEGIDFGWKGWNTDLVPRAYRIDKVQIEALT